MSNIAVVTVTYNSGRVIDGFLASLLNQRRREFLLYVVDNASSDDTLARICSYHDERLRVIANPDNRGIAEANNQGIRRGIADGCEYVLLMNNDTEFGPELLQTLMDGCEQYACDMIAPKILFFDDPQVIWAAGGGLDPRRGYSGFHYGYDEVDRGQFDSARLVEHAPACCLLIRKEVFQRIGMMDPHYFTYVEDTDFSFRAKRAGLSLMYLPSARLLHKAHSLTGGLFSDFMMRYITRNRVFFMLKHFGPWLGLYYIPAYQVHVFRQFVSRNVPRSLLWLREKALLEGVLLWHRSTRGRT